VIFSKLSGYLSECKRATIADLAIHFAAEPDAVRGMLGHLIRKGRVRRVGEIADCPGCMKCDAARAEIYEWTG
jgi:hypothetical protein